MWPVRFTHLNWLCPDVGGTVLLFHELHFLSPWILNLREAFISHVSLRCLGEWWNCEKLRWGLKFYFGVSRHHVVLNEDETAQLYIFVSALLVFIKVNLQTLKGHSDPCTECSCFQYSFEWRKIVSFWPPFCSEYSGIKISFWYSGTSHGFFFFLVMCAVQGSTNALKWSWIGWLSLGTAL